MNNSRFQKGIRVRRDSPPATLGCITFYKVRPRPRAYRHLKTKVYNDNIVIIYVRHVLLSRLGSLFRRCILFFRVSCHRVFRMPQRTERELLILVR